MKIENSSGIKESMEELGRRIKDIRIASCYTQQDLAKKAGLSLSSIYRIERGESVQFDNILSILKALNMLSKLDTLIPVQMLTPMQVLKGETKKKTYRRPKDKDKTWEWGE